VDSFQAFYIAYGPYLWLSSVLLVVSLLIWVLVLQRQLTRAVRHYRLLTQGADSDSIQAVLDKQISRAYETAVRVGELETYCQDMNRTLAHAIQRVGMVRFNPFNDTGGDQSFAVAMLDAEGNGVVLSSIFSRKESRMYAKPVQRGDSRYPLSDEEREAIQQAMGEKVPAQRS